MPRAFVPIFLALCLLLSLTGSAALAAPVLTLATSSVTLEGATPGGQVAWLSVSRRPMETHQRLEIRRELSPVDASGRSELVLSAPLTTKSLWAAVDLATGDYALAAPATANLQQRPLLADAFVADDSTATLRLRHDRLRLEALVVRPGVEQPSAWAGQVQDGGPLDEGESYDGFVDLSPRLLPPLVAEQGTAESFQPGDVVILIDPEALEISAVRLEEEPAGQGGER